MDTNNKKMKEELKNAMASLVAIAADFLVDDSSAGLRSAMALLNCCNELRLIRLGVEYGKYNQLEKLNG